MSRNMHFNVSMLDLEDDASIAVIKAAIEVALAKEMPFIEAEVTISDDQ